MQDHDDDAARHAEMIAEDRQLSVQEGREPVVSETPKPVEIETADLAQSRPAPGGYQGQGQPQQHQQQHEPADDQYALPDVYDDPLGHLTQRMQQMEVLALGDHQDRQFRDIGLLVERSEEQARKDMPADYDAGISHLESGRIAELERMMPDNSAQAVAIAHANGFRTPAEFRDAMLNRDRQLIVHAALQNGIDPARYAFQLAIERGYQPRRAITETQRRQLTKALEKAADSGDYKVFDELWDKGYAKVARFEEERARGR